MTPTPYTPEMRAADARIATAAKLFHVVDESGVRITHEVPGESDGYCKIFDPYFHSDEDARRSLLEWLRADENRWWRFDKAYFRLYPPPDIDSENPDYVQAAFLATPDQVARAADAAIREGGIYVQ